MFVQLKPSNLIAIAINIQAARLKENGYENPYLAQELLEFTIQVIKLQWGLDGKGSENLTDDCNNVVNQHNSSPICQTPLPETYAAILEDIVKLANYATQGETGTTPIQYKKALRQFVVELEQKV